MQVRNDPPKGNVRKELIESLYRLSGLQQGMLFHGLYDKTATAYIKQFACDLIEVDLDAFKDTWDHLLNRHTILRTSFPYDAFALPVQTVYRQVQLPLEILDYSQMPAEVQKAALADFQQADLEKGFDFRTPPLMRVTLINVGENTHRMLWTWHHILFDGWSTPILMEEFLSTYDLVAAGREVPPQQPDRYEDFIRYIERSNKKQQEAYWRNYLNGLEESSLLPFISTTSERNKGLGRYKSEHLHLDLATSAELQRFGQKHRLTINTIVQGVWSYLLHRYTGKDDVVYGVIVSGRPEDLPGVESRIGMYINTIPLRSRLNAEQGKVQWLQNIQREQVASRGHQHTALQEIQQWTAIQGDLFDSLLIFENYPVNKIISASHWKLRLENPQSIEKSNYPLTIIANNSDQLGIVFHYNSDLLTTENIVLIRNHFNQVLLQFLSGTEDHIDNVKLLTPKEEHQILVEFNNGAGLHSQNKNTVDLFREQVAAAPDAIALVFEDQQLSYRELNQRSNQLAHFLMRQGVAKEVLVPVCMERSANMIVAILGVLKAGGAYVPIDPGYPQQRIEYMLQDLKAEILLTGNLISGEINPVVNTAVVDVDAQWEQISKESTEDPQPICGNGHLAYVIYTSGSTGKPKGVKIEHKGLVNLIINQISILGLQPKMTVLQFASLGFDASCSEIFMALLSGSKLVIPTKEDILTPARLTSIIRTHQIDVATLPPSYQVMIKESLKEVPILISAGEPLNASLAQEARALGVRVFNAYGPTENSVCVTMTDDPVLADGRVTIGKPLNNVQVYILDGRLQPVPVNVPGELYIGGEQVARGYLNMPALSSEKFIQNPFNPESGSTIYKSGDLARWLPDGNIQFLGRVDHQVKLSGHRIECGEIETTLSTHPMIDEAVVVLNENQGNRRLTAFYQSRQMVELWPSVAEFFIYDDIVYRSMYEHQTRNEKYRAAIRKVIREKTVLEIGPGPEAILSRLCLKEGAAHVYAVEILEETYLKAKTCIESLGLSDKITLIHADIRDVSLPAKVDYCVSEIVGSIGGSEGSAVLIDVAKQFLKDPSHMIPASSVTKIAAISLQETAFEYGFSETALYYAQKIAEQYGSDFEFRLCLKNLPQQNILSDSAVFEELDYSDKLIFEHSHQISLSIEREGIFNGFYVWMDLYLDNEIHLDIAEDSGSWLPVYFPVSYPGQIVHKGDRINARITRKLSSNNINPDYFLEARLLLSDGKEIDFVFDSYHHQKNPQGPGPFFQQLSVDGKFREIRKPDTLQLRQFLGKFLPDYMVPSAFVAIESIPRTPNGKVDRKKLTQQHLDSGVFLTYVPPKNKTEQQLADIWKDLLQLRSVGVKDNFFDLGGHSLMAMRLVSAIRKELGVELPIKELFLYPTIRELAGYIESSTRNSLLPSIEVISRPERIPLSFSQERLWFIHQMEGSVQYHVPVVLKLKGKLEKDALSFALKNIVNRHEVLRTIIDEKDGQTYQHIMPENGWHFESADFSNDRDGLNEHINEIINRPFDLSADHPLRATLIRLDDMEHILVATMHHVASDGWSMSIMVKEVVEFYNAFLEKRPVSLKPLQVQYADFAIWQRGYLNGETFEQKLDYWKHKLEGVSALDLPTDYPRPPIQSNRGAIQGFSVDSEISSQLRLLSQREGATLFMSVLAAIKVLLYRYTNQENICVGTGTAGRQHQELEEVIGFFVSTLALHSKMDGEQSFTGLLQQVKTTTLEAYENQDVPFEKVVDITSRERDMSRTPLFQVMFSWQNTPDVPQLRLGDVQLTAEPFARNTSKYDLTFAITDTASGLQGTLEYNTDLYSSERISRMIAHFKELLNEIVRAPAKTINSFAFLSSDENYQQVAEFNNNSRPYAPDANIVGLFQEQAAIRPAATALIFEEQEVSYRDLDQRSSALANYLRQRGVKKESLVPLCMDRGVDMIVAILGVLKAGAAYVPIDPEYPDERIQYILSDAGASLVICDKKSRAKLCSANVLEIDTEWEAITAVKNGDGQPKIDSGQLAYVIYTSGTTGRPKGVLVEHGGVVNLALSQKDALRLKPEMRTLQFASFGFDASCYEIFNTLLSGGCLVLPKKEDLLSAFTFEQLVSRHNVELVVLPPSYLLVVKDSLATIKTVVSAGEALNESVGREIISQGIRLVNAYGPTESTVCATLTDEPFSHDGLITIGKPISNVQVFILDAAQSLLPLGSIGELCIGGAQVARGYLNMPELTAQKFVPDVFRKKPGARLYKTGDMARWLPDGNIEFIGRKDDQVKIRGYRIELGEIEACISAMPAVIDTKLIVSESESTADKKLNAYVQVNKSKLPLLSNYLGLLNKKAVLKSHLNILPNGLPLINPNANEVKFLYKEIFEEHSYLKHGIRLPENSCVFDVGANTGFFTIFLNILSENIRVYSFEPVPEVYQSLVANRQLYAVKGKAFELAILDAETDVEFTYYPQVSALSSITRDKSQIDAVRSFIQHSEGGDFLPGEIDSLLEVKLESKQIRCHARTLSQIIADENIEKIDLLKVDVENSEHLVIEGISEDDWNKIENLIIEVHDVDGRVSSLQSMLEKKGFRTVVEKESLLSEGDILYNLFALRNQPEEGLTELGNRVELRSSGWQDPAVLVKDIREEAEKRLPGYMVPAHIVLLDQFPLTSSGKIDKKALPDIEDGELSKEKLSEPASELELALAAIWQELLEVERVGIHDDFFELGGHSLLAVRLVSAIRKELSVELPISDIFDHPTIAELASQLETQSGKSMLPVIQVADKRPARIPLSFSQERLWFIDRLEGSVQYHLPSVLRFRGNLNKEALSFALRTIVDRHEVLRTVFFEYHGEACQLIKDQGQWELEYVEGSRYEEGHALNRFIQELIRKPFDLRQDHMLRATLIALKGSDRQDHVLVVTMHHIASDAWSTSILVKEVVELYSAYEQGRPSGLSPMRLQYADYAIWQRNYLQGEVLDQKIGYWKQKLEGVATLQLPLDYARPAVQSMRGAGKGFELGKEVSAAVQRLSQQEGTTLFMTLLAAFKVLLHRYSGQEDICVGTSIASREQRDLEDMIGFFVNTLALRSEVKADGSFSELLQSVRTTTLDAYANQGAPFEKVVEAVVRERDMSRSSLFQAMLVLQNTPDIPQLRLGEVELSRQGFEHSIAKFDLTFFITETSEGLYGSVGYCADLFTEETIGRMITHFRELLKAIVADPMQKIGRLQMLPLAETRHLLSDFSRSASVYDCERTVVDLFEEQVAKNPAATAVVFEGQELSYGELNHRSNQVARYLARRGVGQDMLVPVVMDRGIDMVTAILGVMKAGAAYVPVDIDFPQDRIAYMVEDSRARVVLTTSQGAERLEAAEGLEVIDLEEAWERIGLESGDNPEVSLKPSALAYVIYTSGSTGRPKGVMIEHRSLVDYVYGLREKVELSACRSFGLLSTIATDLGNTVIYGSLLGGGCLHVFSKDSASNALGLQEYFRSQQIDCIKIVPSHWRALSQGGELLLPTKLLVFGGESLSGAVVEEIRGSGWQGVIVNHYGPTETTIGKLLHVVEEGRQYGEKIPVGRPFSRTRVYVLTESLELCPVGVPGQLYVGGEGVSRGYLNQAELTDQKFIPDSFSGEGKIYGTGDLVKWLSDGNIEFIGRVDNQVKIRGYRVEPGEIERVLEQTELVRQAVVVASEDSQGNKRLIGYVVAEGSYDREGIMGYLKERLADYMIPAVLVPLESMPLTANGKIDRRSLPDPEGMALSGDRYVAPGTEAERALAAIWQELLEVERVGIHDDFFELGGHSLLAVRLVYYLERKLRISIPIHVVFEFSTIHNLINYLEIELKVYPDKTDSSPVKLLEV